MPTIRTVYIETSIPSTYFEQRTEAKMVARRDWTRDWWDNHRKSYRIVTSDPVLDELTRADHPFKQEKIDLLAGVELLPLPDGIEEIVEAVATLPLKTSLVALGVFENGDMEGETWQDVYIRQLKQGAPITVRHLTREEHPAGFSFRNRDMIVIEDTLTEPDVPETSRRIYLSGGVRALLRRPPARSGR